MSGICSWASAPSETISTRAVSIRERTFLLHNPGDSLGEFHNVRRALGHKKVSRGQG